MVEGEKRLLDLLTSIDTVAWVLVHVCTEGESQTHTERERERERPRHTHSYTHREREGDRQTDRHRDVQGKNK